MSQLSIQSLYDVLGYLDRAKRRLMTVYSSDLDDGQREILDDARSAIRAIEPDLREVLNELKTGQKWIAPE